MGVKAPLHSPVGDLSDKGPPQSPQVVTPVGHLYPADAHKPAQFILLGRLEIRNLCLPPIHKDVGRLTDWPECRSSKALADGLHSQGKADVVEITHTLLKEGRSIVRKGSLQYGCGLGQQEGCVVQLLKRVEDRI